MADFLCGGACTAHTVMVYVIFGTVHTVMDLITLVLAGLLESDISKMLSFERFFATIENISKMRVSL